MQGVILGTAAYMVPSKPWQAVDKRTDIWAFGACCTNYSPGSRHFTAKT